MKVGGNTLTVLGSMLLIAGVVRTQYNPDDLPLDPTSEKFIFGLGGIVLGGAGLRLGIPMLVKSAKPERKNMIEMHHYKVGKVVGPLLTMGGGMCLIIGAAKHAKVLSSEAQNSDPPLRCFWLVQQLSQLACRFGYPVIPGIQRV